MSLAGGTASTGVALGVIRARRRARVSADVGKICGQRLAIELHSPVMDKLAGYVDTNRQYCEAVCRAGEFAGQTLALCGAGPSLSQHKIEGATQIWACNSALPYLLERGVNVTAGVAIDQTPALLAEWKSRPDVQYYLASSCDPEITRYLAGRPISWFHSYVGLRDEVAQYKQWPTPMMMLTVGHTVVSRIVGLALWMGFERIDVYGADCALGDEDVAHANGELVNVAYHNPLILTGEVNGRKWRTRPDMLIGAVDLVRQVRASLGAVRLIGDTLPVALLGKPEAFLDSVARMLKPGDYTPPTS